MWFVSFSATCYKEYIYDPAASATFPGPALPAPPPATYSFFHFSPVTGFFMCAIAGGGLPCYKMQVQNYLEPFAREQVAQTPPYDLTGSAYIGYEEKVWITGGKGGKHAHFFVQALLQECKRDLLIVVTTSCLFRP